MSQRRIADYAMIGDGETAALVGRDGAIEWLCFPRFDGEACLTALLGDHENGCWRMMPEGPITATDRRYRGESLILETDLTCETGTIRIVDFMSERGDTPDVVRIVECIEGEVELKSELALRFDYGRVHPLVRQEDGARALAISGPDGVALDFDDPIEFADRRFCTHRRLKKGEKSRFVLSWYPSHEEAPCRVDPDEALRETEAFWAGWIGELDYEGGHRAIVVRSLITLKAMIHRRTGGIVAAPTASLPEELGGERNWDYRFCWLRDATLSLLALTRMGFGDEARAWIEWLRRAVGGDPIDVQPFYTVTGDHRTLEWEAPWLPGFEESTPVRFGNGAVEQLQLDIYGEVIDALYQAKQEGIADGETSDQLMRLLTARVEDLWEQPDAGIWESRGPLRHHTYSKVMCWVAFDRAACWFRADDPELSAHYCDLADRVKALVMEKGWNAERGSFVGAFDRPELDAAVLRLPTVGFIDACDDKMIATVARIEAELCEDGLVRRYDPEDTDDGLTCGEGAFVAVCCWLGDVLYLQGRKDDARAMLDRLCARSNDLGLLAEQLETGGDRQLGNFPQALSHLALIGLAARIDSARGLDRHTDGR
ncbi:glycoside hydrolase family 15 protein [uncultured Croceicoccus sp.]|uniref:glycoside hydrolase family 15 protein n=1 Tax=uncultured Croceicoccus sp. TaxID=1295329 RepID=UPI00262B23FF|nr:glycoside hydrolase family 15 protein [uncultured Croceicoccus sp.]